MTIDEQKLLVVIAGPTACGKTATAIAVAAALDTEIISADSRQFYRELNIGVARPSEDELSAVKHHFIGHLSIHQEYNISKFETDVLKLLGELFNTHDTVVMTGGSGLYIRAVLQGIDELPDADPSVRAMLNAGFARYGIQYLRNRLLDLDPDYYLEVDRDNHMRLIRALEVCISTGVPYSSFRQNTARKRSFRTALFGLDLDRETLNQRINDRVDEMVRRGLLEEARSLYSLRHLNPLNTVGYKELFEHFDGLVSFEEAVEKIRTNTRRYAKKQLTWFRKEPGFQWIQPEFAPGILRIILGTAR